MFMQMCEQDCDLINVNMCKWFWYTGKLCRIQMLVPIDKYFGSSIWILKYTVLVWDTYGVGLR